MPEGMMYDLSLNGNVISYELDGEITEPGNYVLNVVLPSSGENEPAYRSSLRFSISGPAEQQAGEESQEQPNLPNSNQEAPSPPGNLPEQNYADGEFRHSLSPELYFVSNIPNGLVSRVAAEFSIPESATRRMLLNGEETAFAGDETISEPGNYQLIVTNPVTQEEFPFNFVILPQYCREVAPFAPPTGYRIETALKNGEEHPFGPTGVVFDSDGDYVIQMVGDEGYPPFTADFTIDTQAPTLAITGVEEGKATSAEVTFQADDETASVSVLLNGENIAYQGGALTQSGDYHLFITDRAGNSSSYEFNIPFRLNRTALLFIILIVLLLGGGAFYFFRLRKTVKI
jgi:hypothetical protein